MRHRRTAAICALALLSPLATAFSQADTSLGDTVRVTVSMNADGSRTTYQWDNANHKATATTTIGGKMREKIRYVLDDTGRFQTGEVFGPDHTLRFTTRYKYDNAGRLAEESQLGKEGELQHRIVHSYDGAGKEIGYAVYDSAGKLLSQTAPPQTRQTPEVKRSR
jgi:YD repeat-containing protein